MISLSKWSLCVFFLGAVLCDGKVDACLGNQCNPTQGDESALLQSRAQLSTIDLDADAAQSELAPGSGGKKCGWVNMNRGTVAQSSTCWGHEAKRAMDGNADTNMRANSCSHTCKDDTIQWFKWTTNYTIDVQKVKISVADGKWFGPRMHGIEIYVSGKKCATEDGTFASGETKELTCEGSGTEVEVKQPNKDYISMCEFSIYGCYEELDFSYTIDAAQASASQFLIKSTFGPTRELLKEVQGADSYKAWIQNQMTLEVGSHRKYYRERVNPVFDSTTMNLKTHSYKGEGFELYGKSPCAEGSRWANYAFTGADIGKDLTVKKGQIYVGGVFRVDIDSSKVKTCTDKPDPYLEKKGAKCNKNAAYVSPRCDDATWRDGNFCQQTCFDIGEGRPGDDCSGGWDTISSAKICNVMPRMGGAITLGQSKASLLEQVANQSGGPKPGGGPCEKNLKYMANPEVFLKGKVKESDLIFDTNPDIPDVIFLAAGNPKVCGLLSVDAIKFEDKFYLRDTRIQLITNEVNNPTHCAPRTYLNSDGCKVSPAGSKCDLLCGTPFEVANLGKNGHQFEYRCMDFRDHPTDKKFDNKFIAHPYKKDNQPGLIWSLIALEGKDQLRQRMAWALAQIFVTSKKGADNSETETWTNYYDIFVRHAFGNFRDIMQEVTNSPLMAKYLTYLDSGSYDYSGSYPDENYAREIMQLFTIGLEKLHEDGSVEVDANGDVVESYTNEHIMSFARIMTGYGKHSFRWNFERKYKGGGDNNIDALKMVEHKHDMYPKPDLDGNFIGDYKPLCTDLPKQAFLGKGARYEFRGYKEPTSESYLVLDTASALFGKLCPGGFGSCDFPGHVVLDETISCHAADSAECTAKTVELVKVDSAYYTYVAPTCVYLFFSRQIKIVHNRKRGWEKCVSEDIPQAGVTCCDGCDDYLSRGLTKRGITCANAEEKWLKKGKPVIFDKYCAKNKGWRKKKYCEYTCWKNSPDYGDKLAYSGSDCSMGAYREESQCSSKEDRVTFKEAEAFCKSKSLPICNKATKKLCSSDSVYLWQSTPCEVKVTVHEDGKISGLTKHLNANKFTVEWIGDTAPSGESVISIATSSVFTAVPTKSQLTQKLKIGAFPPTVACTHSCSSGDVKAFALNGAIDDDTIFEHNGKYYKNVESQVVLKSGHKFRNPPAFLRPDSGLSSNRKKQQALAEVDAFLDHLFRHPNLPVFIGKKLIQRFETSNPSADYISTVVQAFKSGSYETVGSGQYGDLGATLAAVLLYPTTRTFTGKADGLLREPLLKVLHMIRSMEFDDSYPILLRNIFSKIGEMPYESPTVFNFYEADYAPQNFGPDGIMPQGQQLQGHEHPLLAPEFQIFTPPWAISLLNGIMAFINDGLSFCNGGFSEWEGGWYQDAQKGCMRGYMGVQDQDTPKETLRILDLLLTGGRLTPMDAELVASAYDMAPVGTKMKAAERAIIFTPEFNTLGDPRPKGKRPEETFKTHVAKAPYKAFVNLFFHGGADTYQMLVPRDCKLHDDYAEARKGMDLSIKELLPITAKTQKCKNFGLHPKLGALQSLYNSGDLAFIANVGTLKRATKRDELNSGGYKMCPSQFSHSHAQAAAQTLQCQQLTSAKGVGGKIADVLEKVHNYKSSSFSLAGLKRWSQGVDTHVDVLDPQDGVNTLNDYAITKPLMMNVTGEIYENIYCEEYGAQLKKAVLRSQELSGQLLGAADAIKDYQAVDKLSNQFRQVARAIASRKARNAERDFFFVQLGGFDTHSGVVEVLDINFEIVGNAIADFVKNLKDQRIWDSVVVTTESDFGRTLTFNGGGSDHGWGGNYFILGGSIEGGKIYNDFLETYEQGGEYDAGRGRVIPKYPWESFLVPVAEWMGVDAKDLDTVFPNLVNFNSSLIISKDQLFKS